MGTALKKAVTYKYDASHKMQMHKQTANVVFEIRSHLADSRPSSVSVTKVGDEFQTYLSHILFLSSTFSCNSQRHKTHFVKTPHQSLISLESKEYDSFFS